jgi:hypothetical protein
MDCYGVSEGGSAEMENCRVSFLPLSSKIAERQEFVSLKTDFFAFLVVGRFVSTGGGINSLCARLNLL